MLRTRKGKQGNYVTQNPDDRLKKLREILTKCRLEGGSF